MEDNSSICNDSLTQKQKDHVLIILSSCGLLSVFMCIFTIGLVFFFRLHKYFIYRLAIYQVASSMLLGTIDIMTITLSSYISQETDTLYRVMCPMTGFLLIYLYWINLLFIDMIIFHFFLLAICYKDMQRLEFYYVVISVTFPLLFIWVPFINNGYGLTGVWCLIRKTNSDCTPYRDGIIERYVIWYGPSYLSFSIGLLEGTIIMLVLIIRWCGRRNSEESEPILRKNTDQHRKAMLEFFSWLAFPTIYYVVYFTVRTVYSRSSDVFGLAVVEATFGISFSFFVLVQVLIMRCLKTTRLLRLSKIVTNTKCYRTVNTDVITTAISQFSSPRETDVDKHYVSF